MHPCEQGKNGGCEQTCTKDGNKTLCECREGYKVDPENKNLCKKSKCGFLSRNMSISKNPS